MATRKSPADAWYSPALDFPNLSEKNLTLARLMTVAQGSEGATMLKVGSDQPEGKGSTFYPFFVSAIVAGLVPPFSEFFLTVLRQYNLQALHLHPNSVLLLAIFAYYCEAHVGVKPSMALLRHFFSLRVSGAQVSVCTSFIAYSSSNAISKPGKRIKGYRSKWVMMDVGRLHPRLVLPTGQPKSVDAWSRAELVDPRAKAVLKRMNADLRPSNLGATKLTGATLLREFLEHRVAPLQEHSLMWRLGGADAALRLSSEALTDEDLTAALHSLVGEDVASPVGTPVPLFLHDDWEQVMNAMPTFNGEGLVPAAAPEDLAVLATVNLSSGSSSGEKGEEEAEEEASDSEETGEDWGESFPRRRSQALRSMPDDDEASARRGREGSSSVTRKGRSNLVLPGSALVTGGSKASSIPPDTPSASGPPRLTPAAGSRASSLTGGYLSPRTTSSKCSIRALLGFCR